MCISAFPDARVDRTPLDARDIILLLTTTRTAVQVILKHDRQPTLQGDLVQQNRQDFPPWPQFDAFGMDRKSITPSVLAPRRYNTPL
jgi:hypothetical protein